MTRIILCIAIVVLMISCSKKYYYIELHSDVHFLKGVLVREQRSMELRAKSDSAAYLKAQELFRISKRAAEDLHVHNTVMSSIPTGFKLINREGTDLAKTFKFEVEPLINMKNDTIDNYQGEGVKEPKMPCNGLSISRHHKVLDSCNPKAQERMCSSKEGQFHTDSTRSMDKRIQGPRSSLRLRLK
ncbi:hypothetical protein [Arenibacter lacus]|uniref:hypothetical protein n=1 Tax=Arenibacter lacus TaxID=2608629 RepID=UPI00123CCA7B|nr:hypothetical protein [Arenibacter lacus]